MLQGTLTLANFEIFLVMAAGEVKFVFVQYFVRWRSKIINDRDLQNYSVQNGRAIQVS